MKATITIEMDNAAFFEDDNDSGKHPEEGLSPAAGAELARILRDLAGQVESGCDRKLLFDVNGNRVGRFDIED
jgi:hypothetical protein